MQIDWDVPIPMDDGTQLRANVFRPNDRGQHPILMTHGPYGKDVDFRVGAYERLWADMVGRYPEVAVGTSCEYACWECADPEQWVPDGYALVRVDSRGSGRSPGYIDLFSARETRDYYNCIEWAAAQPWSNGKVGLLGISYYAWNQWQVAALQPPHLAAILPWEGASDFYREVMRHGGIMSVFCPMWFPRQIQSVQHGLGERGPRHPRTGVLAAGPETLSEKELQRNRQDIRADILNHSLDDDYYRSRTPDFSKITVPFLSAANWGGLGLHSRGNFEAFTRAASKQKWLQVHGEDHLTQFYLDKSIALQKRFFDHFLKGVDNGWDSEPPVLLDIRRIDGFVQRKEREWPLARTQWTKLYLNCSDMSLSCERPDANGALEYQAISDGVTFMSPPLASDMEVTGPAALKLFVASSTSDADLFVTLRVFSPAGEEVAFQGANDPQTPISQGWLRASHRKLDPVLSREYRPYHVHDDIQLLTPGQVYECDVEMWPTCLVIPAGYQIALTVQGKDFERPLTEATPRSGGGGHPMRGSAFYLHTEPADRPAEVFDGKNFLYSGGQYDAYVLLPVIPNQP